MGVGGRGMRRGAGEGVGEGEGKMAKAPVTSNRKGWSQYLSTEMFF